MALAYVFLLLLGPASATHLQIEDVAVVTFRVYWPAGPFRVRPQDIAYGLKLFRLSPLGFIGPQGLLGYILRTKPTD